MDTLHHHPYEQLAVWFVMQDNPTSFRLTEDYKELNGIDGQFIRHLIQVPDDLRLKVTKEFYNSLNI